MGEPETLDNDIETDINNVAECERTEVALLLACNELEQRVAEQSKALRGRENLLLDMATQVPGVVYQFYARPNGEMGFYYVSDRSEQVIGLEPDLGGYFERFTALVIPEHREGFIKSIDRAVKESIEWKYEGILQKPTGEKIWFSGNSTPSRRGNEVVFNGIVTDITERKKAEEALRESEEQHRTILQTAIDGFWLVDAQGRILEVNEAYCRMSGYSAQELLAMSVTDLEALETGDDTAAHMQKVMTQGEDRFESRHRRKDGSFFDIEVSIQYRLADGGRVVAFMRDITERKLAEEELRMKDIAIASSINAIAIIDLDDNLTYVNDSFLNLWGYGNEEDVVGKPYHMFWDDRVKAQAVTDTLRQNGQCVGELNAKKKDGSISIVQLLGSIILDSSANAIGMMIALIDITERKKADEALRESERKLRELVDKTTRSQEELKASYSELKASKDDLVRSEKLAYTGRIAASIAHEIRNPLTNVFMSVRQLKKGGRIKPEGLKHSEIIERNVDRINFLITELLNCARPAKLNPQPYDIHRVIKDALVSDRGKIRSQKVKVVKLLSAKPSILKIDKEHMGRVLLNLITNAVDAMPGGGDLTIRTEINKDLFMIKVQDTGTGIPEKDIIKIFDPFFSTKSQGVGLGLTTCYGIVVSHGGTIEVESKWRKGTTFIISLPREREREGER